MSCKFCAEQKGEKNVSIDEIDGTVTIFTEWIYGRLKICATDGGVTAFYQPNFCPECGRDLRKENADD